ncbi:MAG: hypothetical protein O7D30_06845, partial [Rickettsia endosymbiont of Ixodes persulcatus]|nr:hypothetical protein [Rickettsia endosymbiont of Ixodes persulcatus]
MIKVRYISQLFDINLLSLMLICIQHKTSALTEHQTIRKWLRKNIFVILFAGTFCANTVRAGCTNVAYL